MVSVKRNEQSQRQTSNTRHLFISKPATWKFEIATRAGYGYTQLAIAQQAPGRNCSSSGDWPPPDVDDDGDGDCEGEADVRTYSVGV